MRHLGTTIQNHPNTPLSPQAAHGVQVMQRQQRLTPFPYYSTIQFSAAQAGAGPFTYTIPQATQARAFSYGRADNAGLQNAIPNLAAAGGAATECETNILKGSQTIGGQNVYISGLAIQVKHGAIPSDGEFSDARLHAQLDTNAHVALTLNGGDNRFLLGNMGMIPGAGGATGSGYDSLGRTALEGGNAQFGFFNNGWETRSNFFRLPEGLVWRSQGETNSDSSLEIPVTVCRDITLFSGGDAANQEADVAASAGGDPCCVQSHNYPRFVECNYSVFLVGHVIGPRTQSA